MRMRRNEAIALAIGVISLAMSVVAAAGEATSIADTATLAGDETRVLSDGGSLLWQLPMDGSYSMVRPAIGPDGTVYAVDVLGTLYAVAPNGTLRWHVNGAGNKGLAVAADGAIYVASEVAVRAYRANGTVRWTYIQDPFAYLLVGLSIGPDGNLYAIATSGLGVFSLTPNGALRWSSLELFQQPIISYGEIAFGPGAGGPQLYFYANHHLRALGLDGSSVFELGSGGQPVVSPFDGSVHRAGEVDNPDGTLLWYTGISSGDAPAVGPDGTHYGTFLSSDLYALDQSGQERWHVSSPRWWREPTVDPAGTMVLLATLDPTTYADFLEARATADGALLWTLALPPPQHVDNPGVRFTPDGSRAYFVAAAGGSSFLTAVSTTSMFSDGFELGTACAWSAAVGGGCL